MQKLIQKIRRLYNLSIHSIGFYPAAIAIGILAVLIFTVSIEDSTAINDLKTRWPWLSLKNNDVARTIISTIASGILALTAFSFSMVMLVISQAASQMSNRLLDNFIGDRFQQITLGFYIGTILSAFFLLSVVGDSQMKILPSLSVFVLVGITITDIFLFIYFLHYITQSVKYEQLIKKIHQQTNTSLQHERSADKRPATGLKIDDNNKVELYAPYSGYFQGFNKKQLLKTLVANGLRIQFLNYKCSYILKGVLFALVNAQPDDKLLSSLLENIDFYTGQEIDKNAYYGFAHLTEVAVKALSPGINDPGTAVLSINALSDLLAQQIQNPAVSEFHDEAGEPRIILPERDFEELFTLTVCCIWDYGKKDRLVKNALHRMIKHLRYADKQKAHDQLFTLFEKNLNVTSELTF